MAITPRSVDAGVGIGEVFLDKYRVDSILGHGGMGVVALCTHLALNERVAIKMLRKDVLDDADAVERFMREAQAAVKLKSEFVARVSDVGRSDTNVPYMVMEYLEGHDLGDLLDEQGKFSLPLAVELTLQACEALAEAHSLGIVHRDVKPTNLFVTWRPDGSALIKVLDFGISKAPIQGALQLTQTQSLLGTPAYMSPEQMRSARMVDARTDIWSLGTVLYELLEGRRPFEAESFSEMCVKVAVDPPRPMEHTPATLQAVVMRCLEKTPDDRYASMAELARDLVPFSHDPHQAQVLVNRMSRTLRRSAVIEWASPNNSGPIRNSGAVRTRRTGELEPLPPASGAPAVPSALQSGGVPLAALAPAASGPAPQVASQPTPQVPQPPILPPGYVVPDALSNATMPGVAIADAQAELVRRRPPSRSVTMAVPGRRKRRKGALVVGVLLAGATTIGVAIALLQTPRTAPAPTPIVERPAPLPPPIEEKMIVPAPPLKDEPAPVPAKTDDKTEQVKVEPVKTEKVRARKPLAPPQVTKTADPPTEVHDIRDCYPGVKTRVPAWCPDEYKR
ncbi:MAG TPA: protein kinase [Kofleriaceae bacterium]|nr:protein kinase [Kofleriaceae bacterium]